MIVTEKREGYRKCYGPLHSGPTWLPVSDFYVRKSTDACGHKEGQVINRCKACSNYSRWKNQAGVGVEDRQVGWVSIVYIRRYAQELIRRRGMCEAARRAQISRESLRRLAFAKEARRVTKTVARFVLIALLEVRGEDRQSGNNKAHKAYTGRWIERPGGVETR